MMNYKALQGINWNRKEFNSSILNWIQTHNLWNLWVPKEFGGREENLKNGLQILQELARIDGSLGWTITLCSGANYFIGNIKEELRNEIFSSSPILGGSGGAFGTAEKKGDKYILNGTWKYATGSKYLTHFTLNAKILKDGQLILNEKGEPIIQSFVIPKEKVQEIIEDWETFGLKATVTNSFVVNHVEVSEKDTFLYNQLVLNHPIFKIPFALFADLTLWINYIGMTQSFLEEVPPRGPIEVLQKVYDSAVDRIYSIAKEVEKMILEKQNITEEFVQEAHLKAQKSVHNLTESIIKVFPYTGIRGASEKHRINQIFRDFYTGTQHKNFFSANN